MEYKMKSNAWLKCILCIICVVFLTSCRNDKIELNTYEDSNLSTSQIKRTSVPDLNKGVTSGIEVASNFSQNIPPLKFLSSPQDNKETQRLETFFPEFENAYHISNLVWALRTRLSPNGEWFITKYKDESQIETLAIHSSSNEDSIETFQINGDEINALDIWNSTSRSFLIGAADQYSPRSSSQIVLMNLDGEKFEPVFYPIQSSSRLRTSFSPNGEMVAVYFPEKREIHIINLDLELYEKIALDWLEKEQVIDVLVWSNLGIFLQIRDLAQNDVPYYEIYLVDDQTNLINKSVHATRVLGAHPEKPYVLLVQEISPSPNRKTELQIYNLETGEIEKSLELTFSFFVRAANSNPYIAFQVANSKSPQYSDLIIFDWETLELKFLGEINNLVNWNTDLEGFLVLQANEEGYWFEVVHPEE